MTFEQELRKSNNSWYEKGIEQGVVQGIGQGILLQKKDDVIGMKEKGLSISDISDIVKLSIDQVNDILASNAEEELH